MRFIKIALLGIVVILTACSVDVTDEETPNIKACFRFSPTSDIKTEDKVTFTNCSKNVNSFAWNFGDGSISSDKKPNTYL